VWKGVAERNVPALLGGAGRALPEFLIGSAIQGSDPRHAARNGRWGGAGRMRGRSARLMRRRARARFTVASCALSRIATPAAGAWRTKSR